MYLLDSTHCIMIMSGDASLRQKIESLVDVPMATCAVVAGELIFGVYRSEQAKRNIRLIESFLNSFHVYQVDMETAKTYGRLKSGILDRFGPKGKAQRRIARIEKLGFKDNDIWIAAIAKQYDLTIVSADNDFQRLQSVEDLRVENW